ncbi:hypothetical protein [Hymenobacter cellulosilyticus]|uniref:Nucleotide-diphospho-sugar transferase domain-containing protein n=1 Tax=Hymenobacter cellulosilyticus TaxID=2932248 RepID=A0A8T9PZV6_9BACT|nr:hypothetical protein [Hymenobacter cellulosilyticus]UOQ70112.1 hypothetical protein MUN79_15180 [Hymenobacter cellulosilyticus]
MNTFVLISYGRESEYRRAILTVLSFWSLYSDNASATKTIIFTDNPEYFLPYLEGLDVEYALLTAEKIREMKGQHNFIHRLKIAVIEQVFTKYPAADLVYTDSDTFFIADPAQLIERIKPGVSFMHKAEYTLEERQEFSKEARDLVGLIADKPFATTVGEERYDASYRSWNAGALAFSPEVHPYLADVYMLTDEFYTVSKSLLSEQLAFSFILQKRTQMHPCDSYIFHYWQPEKKPVVDSLLAPLFTVEFGNLSLPEKYKVIRDFTSNLPARIDQLLHEQRQTNKDIVLREDAIAALSKKEFGRFSKNAVSYLLKKPTDTKFLKDILYYTKQLYFK